MKKNLFLIATAAAGILIFLGLIKTGFLRPKVERPPIQVNTVETAPEVQETIKKPNPGYQPDKIQPGLELDDLFTMISTGSEEKVKAYLDNLPESGNGPLKLSRDRLQKMIFFKNYTSLSEIDCENIEITNQEFDLEKQLKTSWFQAKNMESIIAKETDDALAYRAIFIKNCK